MSVGHLCISFCEVSLQTVDPLLIGFFEDFAVEFLELIIYPGDQSLVRYIVGIFSRSAGGIRASPLLCKGSFGV